MSIYLHTPKHIDANVALFQRVLIIYMHVLLGKRDRLILTSQTGLHSQKAEIQINTTTTTTTTFDNN
jgi:hypothetical protein